MSATTEAALSVILPAKSRATIEATLEHLRAQTVRGRVELVVVAEAHSESLLGGVASSNQKRVSSGIPSFSKGGRIPHP